MNDILSGGAVQGKRQGFMARMIEMWKNFFVMFVYLWVLFGLFVLNEQVVYQKQGGAYIYHGFAIMNALVLAKVMLVFDEMRLSRGLQRHPLLLTILFEAGLCALLFVVFHIIERYVVALVHGHPLAEVQVGPGGSAIRGLLIIAVILFISLVPFFAFKNVGRVIGRETMLKILFRSPTDPKRPVMQL